MIHIVTLDNHLEFFGNCELKFIFIKYIRIVKNKAFTIIIFV